MSKVDIINRCYHLCRSHLPIKCGITDPTKSAALTQARGSECEDACKRVIEDEKQHGDGLSMKRVGLYAERASDKVLRITTRQSLIEIPDDPYHFSITRTKEGGPDPQKCSPEPISAPTSAPVPSAQLRPGEPSISSFTPLAPYSRKINPRGSSAPNKPLLDPTATGKTAAVVGTGIGVAVLIKTAPGVLKHLGLPGKVAAGFIFLGGVLFASSDASAKTQNSTPTPTNFGKTIFDAVFESIPIK